jgi:hypothetical protein
MEHDNDRNVSSVVRKVNCEWKAPHQGSPKSLPQNAATSRTLLNTVERRFDFAQKILAQTKFLSIIPTGSFNRLTQRSWLNAERHLFSCFRISVIA